MLFKYFLEFAIIERKGAKIMNTDKIYAKRIASEYAPKTTRKIKALIRLDKWIKKPAVITASIIGLISLVPFIIGFYLFVINKTFIGFLIGGIGIIGMSIAPLIHRAIFIKRKNSNANDVLLLAKEIIEEN